MTWLKICGITNRHDYLLAGSLGVERVGLIFHPPSPRSVSEHQALGILRPLQTRRTLHVGVFVNAPADRIRHLARTLPLDLVQLDGAESPEFCHQLGLPFIKALGLTETPPDPGLLRAYGPGPILVEPARPDRGEGSRRGIPLPTLCGLASLGLPLVLAGHITLRDLPDLLTLKPAGLDLARSTERRPGQKDPVRMRHLVETFRHCQSRIKERP